MCTHCYSDVMHHHSRAEMMSDGNRFLADEMAVAMVS